MGVFLALDLFLFFVIFEIVLVPMYFLIGGLGLRRPGLRRHEVLPLHDARLGLHARRASSRPPCCTPAGAGGDLTFDLVDDRPGPGRDRHRRPPAGCSSAFAIAFAVKVPLFPLHTWLPDAHTEAPTAGSVILAGVMLKLGTYGFLRFGLYLFPEASAYFAPLLRHPRRRSASSTAPSCATMQKDLKRLVAYSSVAHLGFIVLGTFALTTQGLAGRRAADGQPRHLHRRPLPPRRHDLRAPPHPADRRAQGPAEGRRRSSPACSPW